MSKPWRPVGFLINPIAGMGGRVGLKGTDDVVARAIELGARPSAHVKAEQTLRALHTRLRRSGDKIAWLTCAAAMGGDALTDAGFLDREVVHTPAEPTTREDTRIAVSRFVSRNVELILFCGGDGTARDVCCVIGESLPLLGIPAGVKMYSGVFGLNPVRTAEILVGFLAGRLATTAVDVLDLDEECYRQGDWVVRLYASALTPYEPTLTPSAKAIIDESTDREVKKEIADYLIEEMSASPEVLFLLGPGSTTRSVGRQLRIDKTLLGIDAVLGRRLVGKDLNERQIAALLDAHPQRKLILSPIGAQGFVLGRGNLQLTPEIIRRIGKANIVIIATPAKLVRTPLLRFDTGDPSL